MQRPLRQWSREQREHHAPMNNSQSEFGSEAVLIASSQGGKNPRLKNLLQNSFKMMQINKPGATYGSFNCKTRI
jgi:hypothetical protein